MSKQTEAKERQQYAAKCLPQTCSRCAYFQFDRVQTNAAYPQFAPYFEDKNMRCGIGGFAVKKMGTCAEWAGVSE